MIWKNLYFTSKIIIHNGSYMKSISFPDIFNNTSVKTVSDHEATVSNLKLLLFSEKTSLFGDPYFGTNLKKLLFEPNNVILQDIVIDDIYTAIIQFMPQIKVSRRDISVVSNGTDLYVVIKALNLLDYTTDLYNINLISYEVD